MQLTFVDIASGPNIQYNNNYAIQYIMNSQKSYKLVM